jgi:hypothetical protein
MSGRRNVSPRRDSVETCSLTLLAGEQVFQADLGVRPERCNGEPELLTVDQSLQLGARKLTF